MGFTAAPTLIAAQSSVDWQQRGVVTASNMFFRSLGSAVGVAIFGAVVNGTLGAASLETGEVAPAPLTTAVHHVFLGTVAVSVVLLVTLLLMPRVTRSTAGQAAASVTARSAAPTSEA